MGEHGALGQAGGAAGVLQHGNRLVRVGDRVWLVRSIVVEQLRKTQVERIGGYGRQQAGALQVHACRFRCSGVIAQRADDQFLQARVAHQPRDVRVQRGQVERDQEVGFAVFHLVLEHTRRVERRVVDDRAAGLQHAKKGDRKVWRVRQVQADVHAGADTQQLKSFGRPIDQRAELAIGDAPPHEVQKRPIGRRRHRVVEQLLHRGNGQWHVPPNAGRVRGNPGVPGVDHLRGCCSILRACSTLSLMRSRTTLKASA